MIPDAPWITYYDIYRNDYYGLTDEPEDEEEEDDG